MIHLEAGFSKQEDWDIWVIGAGGNGSHFLRTFSSFDFFNKSIRYNSFRVRVFDDDVVEPHNTGRQAFTRTSIGLNKADNICSRINMTYGFEYESVKDRFKITDEYISEQTPMRRCIYILAVDSAKFRLQFYKEFGDQYIVDMGNGDNFGQVYFHYGSSSNNLKEFSAYKASLRQRAKLKTPSASCSHVDSVRSQGLFVNNQMALIACNWLYNLFIYNPAEVPVLTYFNSNDMVMTTLKKEAKYESKFQSPLI